MQTIMTLCGRPSRPNEPAHGTTRPSVPTDSLSYPVTPRAHSPTLPPLLRAHSLLRRAPFSGPPPGRTPRPCARSLPPLSPSLSPRPPCDPTGDKDDGSGSDKVGQFFSGSEPSSSSFSGSKRFSLKGRDGGLEER
jgi:hypothetical protein